MVQTTNNIYHFSKTLLQNHIFHQKSNLPLREIEKNGQKIIQPEMYQIKSFSVDVTCFNIPPDMSSLQNFQGNLRSLSSFDSEIEFITYYIEQLKQVFGVHAQIDPSITTSFDLYIQSCSTGKSLALHVPNLFLV